MDMLAMLMQLTAAYGPSGQEGAVADALESLSAPYASEISRDVLGNLIVRRKGAGKRVLFCAHMDSTGFIVTNIDKNGFVRFAKIGGVSSGFCTGTPIRFANGTRGIVCADGNFIKSKSQDDLYIDVGGADPVAVGDTAVFDQPITAQGGAVMAPNLNNRAGCAVLLAALAETQTDNDLYFVFSAQSELGARGAKTAAYSLRPDYAFTVDLTRAGDTPECKPKSDVRLGGGAVIRLMDNSVICHPQVVHYLQTNAERSHIRTQRQVLHPGADSVGGGSSSDAGPIHRSRAGVPTGVISIPARYLHTPQEMCFFSDIEECVKLVTCAAKIP